MRVEQLRRVLDVVAQIQRNSGRLEEAQALVKLSSVLRVADKEQVAKTVEKLKR